MQHTNTLTTAHICKLLNNIEKLSNALMSIYASIQPGCKAKNKMSFNSIHMCITKSAYDIDRASRSYNEGIKPVFSNQMIRIQIN